MRCIVKGCNVLFWLDDPTAYFEANFVGWTLRKGHRALLEFTCFSRSWSSSLLFHLILLCVKFTCTWVQASIIEDIAIHVPTNNWNMVKFSNQMCRNILHIYKSETQTNLWVEVVKMLLLPLPWPLCRLPVWFHPSLPLELHPGLEVHHVTLWPKAGGPMTRPRWGPTWNGPTGQGHPQQILWVE